MSEASTAREAFRKEPHPVPNGWRWQWQDEVFSFEGGTQPAASCFKSEGLQGYVRLVQIRDYYTDAHATYVPASAGLRKCDAGDVMIARYGASLGRICRGIEGAYNVALVRATPKAGVERSYLYYLLQSEYFQGPVLAQGARSAQAGFNRDGLRSILLPLPSSADQVGVSEVLGALDEKISANTKLAQVSDELASVLFHDAVRHSEWSDRAFEDLAGVSGGGTPSTKVPEYWDGDVNWATPTDVTALKGPYLSETDRRITQAGLSACSSALHQRGAILMTSRATIGAFAIVEQPTAVNQGFIVVAPTDPKLKWWLFHEMRSRVDEFISLANGATFLELSRGSFRTLKVRLSTESTIRQFDARAESLHAASRAALDENRTLAATRDALLPQLVSGKLRVSDAEKVLEGVL